MPHSEAREGQLGCPAGPEVINLVKAREWVHGKQIKSVEELKAIHSNTPWVLLRSGVNIKSDKDDTVGSSEKARQYVFCGALASPVEGAPADNRSNIGPYRKSKTTGWKPIPGITSIEIQNKDQWGAILEATVNLKVMDRETLEDVDALYFKPGMVALLEFGHSIFVNEKGKVEYASINNCLSNELFFKTGANTYFSEIAEEVRKLRVKNHNYEALCGYITNFSWKLEKDGTYSCTVRLLSQGVILKGLQLRSSGDFFKLKKEGEQKDVQKVLGTSIMLDAVYAYNDQNRTNFQIDTALGGGVNLARALTGAYSQDRRDMSVSVSEQPNQENLNLVQLVRLRPEQKLEWVNGRPAKANILNLKTVCRLKASTKKVFDDTFLEVPAVRQQVKMHCTFLRPFTKNSFLHYITLRDALYILEYFNIDKDSAGGDLCYFNLNANYDYVDAPYCFSLNPAIAVKGQQIVNNNIPEYARWNPASDTEKYYVRSLSRKTLKLGMDPTILDDNPSDPSRILNIWITLEHLEECVRSVVEANTEGYTVYEIVETLLTDIQKAFGNINNFKLYRNHSLECWEVVDWNHINGETLEASTIRITGTKNTVSEFDIHSEVSDDLANQMSIAAQSPKGSENNASMQELVHWNENSVSRFVPGKPAEEINNNQVAGASTSEDEEDPLEKFWDLCEKIYKAINWEDANMSAFDGDTAKERLADAFTQIQAEGERFIQKQANIAYVAVLDGNTEGQGNLQNGVFPYKASLTMKGLGGFTIGTIFKMDEQVLPSKYKDWGNIITGVSHKIDPSGWFTTLKTCYYPIVSSTTVTSEGGWVPTSAPPVMEDIITGKVVPGGQVAITEASGRATRVNNFWGWEYLGDMEGGVDEVKTTVRRFENRFGTGKFVVIYRNADENVAKKAAKLAADIAACNLIGYSQTFRDTLYDILVDDCDGDFEKFKSRNIKVGVDCSALCHTCYAAVDPKYRVKKVNTTGRKYSDNTSRDTFALTRTGLNMEAGLVDKGTWTKLLVGTDIKSVNDLKIGDVIWKPGHAAMVTGLPESNNTPSTGSSTQRTDYVTVGAGPTGSVDWERGRF